ncbi:MAG TPA: bifunctional oligoribonuclease/PAP phosphatase NrnA [Chloroflexota bacterium]
MTETVQPQTNVLESAVDMVRDAETIGIVAHVNPDADALGSILGLTLGLEAIGKRVVSALSDPVPEYARFLAGTERITSDLPDQPLDLYIFADSAEIHRVGEIYVSDPSRFEPSRILNIDHHRTNPAYGRVNYIDPGASSTSEMVFRLIQSLGAEIDRDTATALLFGIVGDTGSFRNGATTPGSLDVSAQLVARGADIQRIAFHLFESKTFAAARLWGRVLSTIELDAERGIVFAFLTQVMLAEEGATIDETEGIVEYLRGITEAEVVLLLRETEDGNVRVSMRSRPAVDVSAIAKALDGGGHRQAAGCTIPGTFETAKTALVETFDRLNPR